MPRPGYILYRCKGDFPLHFTFLGQPWRIEVNEVAQAGGSWRAMMEGGGHWFINEEKDEASLLRALRETGVEIPPRAFPGTVFQHLERQGLAERVHVPDASRA